jgi:ribosomal protein S15
MPCRSFTSSAPSRASTVTQKRKYRDPYAIAQAKARKAANLSRQEVLRKQRTAALGDPVKGVETPYLRSLDAGIAAESSNAPTSSDTAAKAQEDHLNFYLNKPELDRSIQRSIYLSTPSEFDEAAPEGNQILDETVNKTMSSPQRNEEQDTAREALRRISSLSLANSKDLFRINTKRIISDFGRHNTDTHLPPRPASAVSHASDLPKTPRAGPDTGSSEVQIALLTAKIRTLSQFLETRGTMDKMNKRNLRLLVHRRQKLMAYLRRKERGGARWQNLVETLGLTEGMWRGQIVLDRNLRRIEPGTLKHTLYKDEKARS